MGRSVLVVDDELSVRVVYSTNLTLAGYTVYEASSAGMGIDLALSQNPDLIITDRNMPGMNGYEMAKILKENPKTKDIPIWGIGDFPFYYIQIAPYNNGLRTPNETSEKFNSAYLREAQLKAMNSIPNCGMAVIMDTGEKVEKGDTVHFIKVRPFNYKGSTFTVKPKTHIKDVMEINVEDYVRNMKTALEQIFAPMGIELEKPERKISEWFE